MNSENIGITRRQVINLFYPKYNKGRTADDMDTASSHRYNRWTVVKNSDLINFRDKNDTPATNLMTRKSHKAHTHAAVINPENGFSELVSNSGLACCLPIHPIAIERRINLSLLPHTRKGLKSRVDWVLYSWMVASLRKGLLWIYYRECNNETTSLSFQRKHR